MSVEDIFEEYETPEGEKPTEEVPATEEPKAEEATEKAPAEVEIPPEEAPPEEFFEEPKKVKEETEAEEFFGEEVTEEKAEAPPPKPKPAPTKEEKFDTSEAEGTGKTVFMIYGLKGHGKTDLAYSLQGKIACLSFDRKSLSVKTGRYKNDQRIKVYDAVMYLDKSSAEAYLESSEKTFRYVNVLLGHIAKTFEPDWIIFDGSDIFQRICEMTMRYRNNLMPFQGIANRNLWKERNLYVDQAHNSGTKIARKGVIYTAYTSVHEIVKEGEFIIKEDVPKWIGEIMTETDIVIKAETVKEKSGLRFYASVESNKASIEPYASIPNGDRRDISNVGMKAFEEVKNV